MKKPEEIKNGVMEAIEEVCWAVELGDAQGLVDAASKARDALFEALDCIRHFDARVPRWIPVKERLPEEHQDVLVWAVYHDEDGRDWALEEIDRYCEACGWDNTADTEAREVTHWMPKHKPPEEDRNEYV